MGLIEDAKSAYAAREAKRLDTVAERLIVKLRTFLAVDVGLSDFNREGEHIEVEGLIFSLSPNLNIAVFERSTHEDIEIQDKADLGKLLEKWDRQKLGGKTAEKKANNAP